MALKNSSRRCTARERKTSPASRESSASWTRNTLRGAAVWALLLLGQIEPVFYRAAMVHIALQTTLAAVFMAVLKH